MLKNPKKQINRDKYYLWLKYIYYIKFEDKNCISLIGKPIYKFMSRIEEMLPYED